MLYLMFVLMKYFWLYFIFFYHLVFIYLSVCMGMHGSFCGSYLSWMCDFSYLKIFWELLFDSKTFRITVTLVAWRFVWDISYVFSVSVCLSYVWGSWDTYKLLHAFHFLKYGKKHLTPPDMNKETERNIKYCTKGLHWINVDIKIISFLKK